MIGLVTMLRAAALLCAAMLMMQAMAACTPLGHPASRSVCTDDDADGGPSTGDEALTIRRVLIARPAASRQSRWDGPELSVVPSPAPDEILHVPRASSRSVVWS
jgi:hypothetical protein